MEETSGLIVIGTVIFLFVILSLYLLSGRGAFLIAGHNMLPKEDRMKIDEPALCRAMGKLMLAVTLSMLFYIPGAIYESNIFFIIGTVGIVISIIIGLIYMNIGNRYDKKDHSNL
ncbi:hypothetical protein KZO01_02980 [Kurthia zopfii]|uniref:Domain of uncharacterized function (DUF3784) n=1 Tax=Kurthia zopfii TaxID=1650 RepID=A0A2U3AF67_9BACL|nr:DUF3784 domain-containing protein [Kurthia zopfii]PWI23167.1 hypothetical protein DF281_03840 [Kurthia zopfii]TDR41347.1 uncharacterized protein DUF3784 [Kurthia zopfii]STX09852.1 Domain of uncharacterised function (DUF3784) [Kurthia zopfii]VEI07262.1 Domain of uncharacterised function (DUF3784) [Kurthia zopfii]GEK29989.1 hypothetical protein KZO01_02980 [Kurthia zopfii]